MQTPLSVRENLETLAETGMLADVLSENGDIVLYRIEPPKAALIVKAVNAFEPMKRALLALLHEPMSERAVDQAKRALTLAEGG